MKINSIEKKSKDNLIVLKQGCQMAELSSHKKDYTFVNCEGSIMVECVCSVHPLVCLRSPTSKEIESARQLDLV